MSHEPQLQQFIGEFQILRSQKIYTSPHKNILNVKMIYPLASLPEDAQKLVEVPVGTSVEINSVQRLFKHGMSTFPPRFYALGSLSIEGTTYEFEYRLGGERGVFSSPPWLSDDPHGVIRLDWNNIETIYFTEDVPLAFPSKRFSPQ